jgi:hypothetical protein
MAKFIDVVLTADGFFCIAPSWSIEVGDYISIENVLTGAIELKKVIAKATDSTDGDFIKLVEIYLGYKPTRVTKKYRENNVYWEDEANVSE